MKSLKIPILLSLPLAFAQGAKAKQSVEQLDALVVESSPLKTKLSKSTQATNVLEKDELNKARGLTISETLSDVPGVSQSHFGPSANRPIIRGLDKNRVRILQNGVDTFDVSAQSEDHAVSIDPLLIKRIEVLRGSSALAYGSSSIGGVVNVIDRSIPTESFGRTGASVRSSYNSVNEGWNYGAIGYTGNDQWSFQINGSKKDYENYDTPDFVKPEENSVSSKVEGSYGDISTVGFGGSRFWNEGYAGFSFSNYENTYGVPGEEVARIELESDRFEAKSEVEINDSEWLTGIELGFGYGDYLHAEFHGDEDPAKYFREGLEGRVGLKHQIGSLQGVLGVHGLLDELKIQGEESIFAGGEHNVTGYQYGNITKEDSTKLAIFLVEEFDLSEETVVNGGIRWEAFNRDLETNGTGISDDSTVSANLGFTHQLNDTWNFSSNVNYSERLPDVSELYSYGAHHATHTFEVGDPNLGKESAVGFEVILRKTVGKVTGQISAFHTEFDNYIYSENEDEREHPGEEPGHHLPEMQYQAVDAEFQGIEAELDWLAMENSGWSLLLSAYGDVLRGKNKKDNTNLPRISPARLGIGFEIQTEKLSFGMDVKRVFKQDKISGHGDDEHGETATAAYSLLNAFASYDLSIGKNEAELFIRGNNLTDELAYNHTSPSSIKGYTPLPGASVEIGLGFDF
jgi:iron complex outermembrane receptor protein